VYLNLGELSLLFYVPEMFPKNRNLLIFSPLLWISSSISFACCFAETYESLFLNQLSVAFISLITLSYFSILAYWLTCYWFRRLDLIWCDFLDLYSVLCIILSFFIGHMLVVSPDVVTFHSDRKISWLAMHFI
jgi:hypothetical protein